MVDPLPARGVDEDARRRPRRSATRPCGAIGIVTRVVAARDDVVAQARAFAADEQRRPVRASRSSSGSLAAARHRRDRSQRRPSAMQVITASSGHAGDDRQAQRAAHAAAQRLPRERVAPTRRRRTRRWRRRLRPRGSARRRCPDPARRPRRATNACGVLADDRRRRRLPARDRGDAGRRRTGLRRRRPGRRPRRRRRRALRASRASCAFLGRSPSACDAATTSDLEIAAGAACASRTRCAPSSSSALAGRVGVVARARGTCARSGFWRLEIGLHADRIEHNRLCYSLNLHDERADSQALQRRNRRARARAEGRAAEGDPARARAGRPARERRVQGREGAAGDRQRPHRHAEEARRRDLDDQPRSHPARSRRASDRRCTCAPRTATRSSTSS